MWIKILLLFFVYSFLFRIDTSFNQDLGRHIKLGEIIIQTKSIPKTNLFSYTNPDFPFINTHWLFEVLAYGFNQTIGIYWLLILKFLIILLSVWLVIKTIPKSHQALLLPVGFIFLHVLRERLELRPEIFSFLFTAITLFILEKFLRERTRWIFLLPLIQLVWINTHIYFFIGLMLQAFFIIHLAYQKLRSHSSTHSTSLSVDPEYIEGSSGKLQFLSIIFGLSVLISFINPNGIQEVLYPLNVTKNYGYTIVENQTMFLLESIQFRDANFLFVKLSTLLVGLSLIVGFFRKTLQLRWVLLSISGVTLALMHVRSFPYLVFLSFPAVLQNFGVISWNGFTKTLTILLAVILLLESFFYLNGDYYRMRDDYHQAGFGFEQSVKGALDFVLTQNLPGPIYNNFDIGSYILYRGYPKYQVFIDGRPEAYPASFFSGVYMPSQSNYKNFKELEKIYNFKTIIFSHTDQTPWGRVFLQSVVKDPDWKLVYIDDFVLVLTKEEMEPIDLSNLNPNSYKFDNHVAYLRLGLFLLSTEYQESARKFIQKSLQIFPNSPVANSILGRESKNTFFW
ncbi:hypothetical protein HYS94_04350 [Candidatus Daviesbacteria bacterium]|nr:hypothetical protein [Candidatus Daviesbacteria bacterium]